MNANGYIVNEFWGWLHSFPWLAMIKGLNWYGHLHIWCRERGIYETEFSDRIKPNVSNKLRADAYIRVNCKQVWS